MSYLERLRALELSRKGAPPEPTKPTKAPSVGSVGPSPASFSEKHGDERWGYSLADLAEMDKLLRELSQLENWSPEQYAEALDCRKRMAPVRVPEVLAQLRKWTHAAIAVWPNEAPPREKIVLIVFDGENGAV